MRKRSVHENSQSAEKLSFIILSREYFKKKTCVLYRLRKSCSVYTSFLSTKIVKVFTIVSLWNFLRGLESNRQPSSYETISRCLCFTRIYLFFHLSPASTSKAEASIFELKEERSRLFFNSAIKKYVWTVC